jgi:hypothetical protein
MKPGHALQTLALRAAVGLPLATLLVAYAVGRPAWPTCHPSAVFDHDPARVIASLGFALSGPSLALLGVLRHARDRAAGDHIRAGLRGGLFAAAVAGLLGVTAVPWHVSRTLHTATAVIFFACAAADLVAQQRTAVARRRRPAGGALSGRAHAASTVGRGLGLGLCATSLAGQAAQSHPLMSVGEVGFAVAYLAVLGLEVAELERLGLRLESGAAGVRHDSDIFCGLPVLQLPLATAEADADPGLLNQST